MSKFHIRRDMSYKHAFVFCRNLINYTRISHCDRWALGFDAAGNAWRLNITWVNRDAGGNVTSIEGDVDRAERANWGGK